MVQLVVVATPEKHLVYTNKVYISLEQTDLLPQKNHPNYIIISEVAFVVEGHKLINPGELGLSSLQRESLRVSQSAAVNAEVYQPTKFASKDLFSIVFEIELLGQGRKTIAEADLAAHIRTNNVGSLYNVGQLFIVDFVGSPLKFTVKALNCVAAPEDAKASSTNVVKTSKRGFLQDFTEVDIEATTTKFLIFQADKSKSKSALFDPKWKFEDMGIGGLDAEFNLLFRRAFASRIFPTKLVEKLGIKHVKGMILYGPPGTGKTLIARQIGKMLATREPKIVNGPEVLNKFVGQSEENIRKLFVDAEEDQKANGENSDLHLIIFDELDAICKARASRGGGDTGVGDTVVNQLLSKIDGVNSLNNILIIGMTNRKDLIDPALLRPGRLEVHIEISLPDEAGRLQILHIHTKKMSENGLLAPDVDLEHLAAASKNFSGAEIEGLVKSASSFALYSAIDLSTGNVSVNQTKEIKVTRACFEKALEEIKPSFGVDAEDLKDFVGDVYDYGTAFNRIMARGRGVVDQLRNSQRQHLITALFSGPVGSGKTAIAAQLAMSSDFPFVRMIRPSQFLGMTETSKCARIAQIFEDAYKSPLSCIFIDSLENLIEYIPVGPRFSNAVLQTIIAFTTQPPPHNRKLLIFATTNKPQMLEELGCAEVFQNIPVGPLTDSEEVKRVFQLMQVEVEGGEQELEMIALTCPVPITIKALLNRIDYYTRGDNRTAITADIWKDF